MSQPTGQLKSAPQILVTLVAVSGAISVGGCIAMSAVLIPALQKEEDEALRITLKQGALLVTLWVVPSMVGCLVGGSLADRIGRKKVLVLGQIPFMASWVLTGFANSLTQIFVARTFMGFSEGLVYSLLPVYISEITSPAYRGGLANLINVFSNTGMLLTYIFGVYTHWRVISLVMFSCSLVSFLLMLLFLYETPYFLITRGREKEARTSMQCLRGQDYNVAGEIDEILERKRHNDAKQANGGGRSTLKLLRKLAQPTFLYPYASVGGTYFLSQITGVPTLTYFLINIFQDSGTSINPYMASVMVVAMRLTSSLLSSVALKMLPRKLLFLFSGMIMAFGLFVIAVLTYLKEGGSGDSQLADLTSILINWLPIICVMMILAFQAFGFSAVIRVYIGEVFPTEIRSLSSSICLVSTNVGICLAGYIYPFYLEWFGFGGTFIAFGVSTFLATLYGFLMMPDSQNKTLIDMEEYYEQMSSTRKRAKTKGESEPEPEPKGV